jgi:uncharacterized membrane protein
MVPQMLPVIETWAIETWAMLKGSNMEMIRRRYGAAEIGTAERGASLIAGSLLTYYGLRQRNWTGKGLALLGLGLLRIGMTGSRQWYRALGIDTKERAPGTNQTIPYETGIRVDEAITINLPRHEVYQFWRNPENLAEFMEHVESVRPITAASAGGETNGGRLTHWVARGPAGRRMEWDAQIINEIENEIVAWRSLPGSEVTNAGSVNFADAAGGRGTEVRIALQYNPPGGAVGAFVARIFGEEPSTQIHRDLMRLKTQLEAGEVPTVAGQPAGAKKAVVEREHHRKAEQVVTASEASFPASDAPAYTH